MGGIKGPQASRSPTSRKTRAPAARDCASQWALFGAPSAGSVQGKAGRKGLRGKGSDLPSFCSGKAESHAGEGGWLCDLSQVTSPVCLGVLIWGMGKPSLARQRSLAQRPGEAVWTSALTRKEGEGACVPEEKLGALGGLAGCHCWATGCATQCDSEQVPYLHMSNKGHQLNGKPLLPACTVLGTKIGLTNTGTQDTHPY